MTKYNLSKESRKRIELMCSTNDGFELAEEDLKMRGPGDFEGTRQSGMAIDLKISNLSKDSPILERARLIAMRILEKDPQLENPENRILNKSLQTLTATEYVDYSKIS